MTAYPVIENLEHWWLATSTSWGRRLHAIAGAALDPSDEDAMEALCSAPYPCLTSACGRTKEFTMPGVLSRLAMKRCAHCCRNLGIPAGNGTPANGNAIESLERPGSVASTTGPITHTDYRNPVQDD